MLDSVQTWWTALSTSRFGQFKYKYIPFNFPSHQTCLLGSSKALTKVAEALEADRIVSVRPSLNIRREALSYVAQQRWYILPKEEGRQYEKSHTWWSSIKSHQGLNVFGWCTRRNMVFTDWDDGGTRVIPRQQAHHS